MKRIVVLAMTCLAAALPAQQPRVERYEFRIVLPDTGKRIYGETRIRLAEQPAVLLLELDLDGSMKVGGVEMGCGEPTNKARFEHVGSSLRVPLTRIEGVDTRCVTILYSGEPRDGMIIGTDSAGRWTAFGDNFPDRARYWLPTVDHPSAKARVTWTVEAPEGRTIVANGALVSTSTNLDGRVTTTWHEDRAIPTYDMVFAAAPLVMHDLGRTACGFAEDGGCVPQMVYTAPEQARYLPGNFARAGEIVEFFSRTVGAYPYEKLAHVQSSTRYGGMENASEIYYADQLFRKPNGLSEGLIAHETAHQWFGNAVTEREWAHAWLSEGFATFFAALWTQHTRGDSAYHSELSRLRQEVIRAKVASERAVIDSVETDPNRLLNENTYQKGGWVLHMLRTQLGDSAFFAGVRRYFAEHKHGNAMTQDLQRSLEMSSGRELGWFFDQWLRRPGWAQLSTAWHWDSATKRVTLEVEQESRFGAYRLPLTIDVEVAGGGHRRMTVDVDAVRSQRLSLPGEFAAAPRALVFDPDVSLLAAMTTRR
ncbi:MAG: M1 family metallopeptidase [Gemmatimonadota bacterium]